eukprot:4839696-Pyramimonas_sp.AAC.1
MDIPRSIDVYADDITVHVDGALRHMVSWPQRILRMLAHALKALGLPPAAHKMRLTSSIPALGKHVAYQLRDLGHVYAEALE